MPIPDTMLKKNWKSIALLIFVLGTPAVAWAATAGCEGCCDDCKGCDGDCDCC
jgi:hypothetical protein